MKAIIVLVVLLGLGVAGVYFLGGYGSFDPDEQGNKAKAAITTGMSWKKVLDITGKSDPRYRAISMIKDKDGNEYPKPGPEVNLDRTKLASRVKNGEVRGGFIFVYRYSEKVAFEVTFDSSGNVTSVDDIATMADLLHTR